VLFDLFYTRNDKNANSQCSKIQRELVEKNYSWDCLTAVLA